MIKTYLKLYKNLPFNIKKGIYQYVVYVNIYGRDYTVSYL